MALLANILLVCACIEWPSLFVKSYYYPEYEPKYGYPLYRKRPYSFPTYTPVAFTSSSATPVYLSPLEICIHKNASILVSNDGVIETLYPYNGEVGTLTGGHVFKDRYVFAFANFRSNGDADNFVHTQDTQDGVGFPVGFTLLFRNKRYGSFNNCLKYRDGLVTLVIPVKVEGKVDNVLFTPFEKILYKIQKPNSTALISAEKAFFWLFKTLRSPYYCYPGAYKDLAGKFYDCTNDVRANFHEQPWISYSQFKAFVRILNKFGQPLVGASPLFPLAPRPFVEASSPLYVEYL